MYKNLPKGEPRLQTRETWQRATSEFGIVRNELIYQANEERELWR